MRRQLSHFQLFTVGVKKVTDQKVWKQAKRSKDKKQKRQSIQKVILLYKIKIDKFTIPPGLHLDYTVNNTTFDEENFC